VPRKGRFGRVCAVFLGLVLPLSADRAWALDKQGKAKGAQGHKEDGFAVSGAVSFGAALYNPSYAARPDNSGLALFRYALHLDVDLIGRKLSIPIDVNMFSDRTRKGGLVFAPTELDLIGGVASTWEAAGGSFDAGLRFEHDRALDRLGFTQSYADLRVRYVFDLAHWLPNLRRRLLGGNVTGWLGHGTFLFNPTYAARPDNSGLALFRYSTHAEVSFFEEHVALGADASFFTDRQKQHFTPSELDLTVEIIGRYAPWELHLAYERDMPTDRRGQTAGFVQDFVYVLASYAFDSNTSGSKQTTPVAPGP
jgi:hypothetical protein